jgi:hypothetical protein
MASNFVIDCEWDRDVLHMHVVGNFDEASASDLIDALKENCHDASVVFVETKDLSNIDLEGCEAFRKEVHVLQDFCYRLVFVDRNADRITPKWTECF